MNKNQAIKTIKLLNIVVDKDIEGIPDEVLDDWVSECGSYGCVLGDYVIQEYPHHFSSCDIEAKRLWVKRKCYYFNFETEFGFSNRSERVNVIGSSRQGSLKERADYIRSMLIENGYEIPEELR